MNRQFLKNITAVFFGLVILFVVPFTISGGTKQIPQRSEIEDKYKWNLGIIYPSIQSWELDFEYLKNNYKQIENYKGRLDESGTILYDCLKLNEKINIISERLSTYAGLKLCEDNRQSAQQELSGRIRGLNSKIRHASSYIESELLTIDPDKFHSFMAENDDLEVYRFYLEDLIRRKEHILSPREEAILALSGSVAYSAGRIYSMLTEADMKFGTIYDEDSNVVELTEERYDKFRKSTDRRVRRDSHEDYYGTYEKYANTFAVSLGSALQKDYFYMKTRRYNSCLEMSLFENNIPVSVYHNLIKTVNDNLESLHKWAALKKKILGYDTLYPYDLYVSLVPNQNREYSYEEAMALNLKALAVMGEPYFSDFKKGLESGWIDVYETEGKSTGAFSGGSYDTPPYVLLNYNGTLGWVFTLAHEMGHSMHSFYTNKNQPYIYTDYATFVAEVASTCNETLLMKYLLNKAKTNQEKMYLLNYYIQSIRTTFFRQVMFAEFELTIHSHIENGGAVSADYLRQTFSNIYQKYWGESLTVDELSGMLGMVVPHFYWQYYVYQYATSYAAAQLMAQKIIDEKDAYVNTYMEFLSAGSSKYPIDILKDAGIDMTQPEPILYTINLFSDMVDELEKMLEEN